MENILKRFSIEGLHGIRTINVTIRADKLVLVGENGTGKSTIANLIYFFLTRQWTRMLHYEFKSISAEIKSKSISLSREDIQALAKIRERSSKLTPTYRRRIESMIRPSILDNMSTEDIFNDDSNLKRMARQVRVPYLALVDYILSTSRSTKPDLPDEIIGIDDHLKSAMTDQVLYLPTYRRIEQDLQSIFVGQTDEIERIGSRFRKKERNARYIESVEFGMENVNRTIDRRMAKIKDANLNDLTKFTGIYLSDVILGTYKESALSSKLKALNVDEIDLIVERIPKDVLSRDAQVKLREFIQNQLSGQTTDENKVIAYFITQLIEIHKNQQQRDKDVVDSSKICNKYLTSDKQIVYDNLNYTVSIQQTQPNTKSIDLKMRDLSSGEKQVVSLFSHIYLSGQQNYFIIIDEPELSLSVPWQKSFLTDILNTNRCNGLIAVTHSPYVYYETELQNFTHSVEEFTEDFNDIS